MAAANAETLRHAFDAFNEQSSSLEASYRDLQNDVELLTRELKLVQLARHREYVEKERLGNRLTRTLEALPAAVVVLDGGGIIREKNSKATELLNQPLLDCAWSDIVRREFRPTEAADGDICLRDGRWLNLSRRPLGSERGEILLLADVTESRRMANLLQRRERLSSMGEMTARLAHQIRTPLASALLYTGQLDKRTDKQKTIAKNITERLNDLVRMADDMLRYTGGARRSGESFSVTDLFQDILESTRTCSMQDFLRVAVARADLRVEGNRDAIKGALLNLVENARQASGDSADIELGAEITNNKICLTVSDNGHGILADIKDRLFDPFFTTRPQGTGLGLTVVRAVAEAHDGDILVDSNSRGSTFALCLPICGDDA